MNVKIVRPSLKVFKGVNYYLDKQTKRFISQHGKDLEKVVQECAENISHGRVSNADVSHEPRGVEKTAKTQIEEGQDDVENNRTCAGCSQGFYSKRPRKNCFKCIPHK